MLLDDFASHHQRLRVTALVLQVLENLVQNLLVLLVLPEWIRDDFLFLLSVVGGVILVEACDLILLIIDYS